MHTHMRYAAKSSLKQTYFNQETSMDYHFPSHIMSHTLVSKLHQQSQLISLILDGKSRMVFFIPVDVVAIGNTAPPDIIDVI